MPSRLSPPPAGPRSRGAMAPSRAAAMLVAVGWVALSAWWVHSPGGISWHWFVDGDRWLGTSGTDLYAVHPEVQIGPLALVLVRALAAVGGEHALVLAQILSMLALVPVTWALLHLASPSTRWVALARVAAWALLVPAWAVLALRWTHVDDVLALTALAVLAGVIGRARSHAGPSTEAGVGSGSAMCAALLVVVATGAKPWAIVGLPLLLALPGRWRVARRPRAVAVAIALVGIAACYLPFVWEGLLAGGPPSAMTPRVRVADTTLLWWLGLHDAGIVPSWVRTVQLLGAPVLALVVVLRCRWPLALLAGVAARLLVDPQNNAYYAAGAVLVALIADVALSRLPWRSLLTAVVFWQPFVPDYAHRLDTTSGLAHWWFTHPFVVALVHATWAALMIADALTARVPSRAPTD